MKLQAVQVFNVQFDTTDDGIEELSQEEITQLEEEVEGQIYEIDVDKRDAEEFEYALCEEITSQLKSPKLITPQFLLKLKKKQRSLWKNPIMIWLIVGNLTMLN